MNPFPLAAVPALSRSTATRDDDLRRDPARLDALWATGRVLVIDRTGRTPVDIPHPAPAGPATAPNGTAGSGGVAGNGATQSDSPAVGGVRPPGTTAQRSDSGEAAALSLGQSAPTTRTASTPPTEIALRLRPAPEIARERPGDAVLLGTVDGVGYWSVTTTEKLTDESVPPPNSWGLWPGARSTTGEEWHDLRAVGGLLDDTEAGMFTTAVAVHGWHARARFCARCGAATERISAGWATRCTACGREEYPRTDPAVICLVHDPLSHQVLLARQPVWPAERYSVLAGFVEAGESLEACVEREVAEEVGVAVHSLRYLGSQPWPFPRSVMIAFAAEADPSHPLRPADGEIEHAQWVPKARVRAALAAGGELPGLRLPGVTSIARQMLAGWAAHD